MQITRRTALIMMASGAAAAAASVTMPARVRAKRELLIYQPTQTSRLVGRDPETGAMIEFPFGDNGDQWVACHAFNDGRKLLVWSCPWSIAHGKGGFSTDYRRTPTKFWIYDCQSASLSPTGGELFEHVEPLAMLPDESGFLATVVHPNLSSDVAAIDWNMRRMFGFKDSSWGERYCLNWNPDKSLLAFHVAGPSPRRYWACISDVHGDGAVVLCNQYEKSIFGPIWSPDGSLISCIAGKWSGDDSETSDIYLIDPVTRRATCLPIKNWSSARSGPPGRPVFGTNLPRWAPNGDLLIAQPSSADAHSPYHINRTSAVDDHFNSGYSAGSGIGGTAISLLSNGSVRNLTDFSPGTWVAHPMMTKGGTLIYRRWLESDPEHLVWVVGDTEIPQPHRMSGIYELRI